MMPFLITFNIFAGGMYVIIDATAGERERGSLEPLLINPAKRWEFVIGKLLASLPFALFSLGLVLFIFWPGFHASCRWKITSASPWCWTAARCLAIFLLCLPEVLLASALQMLVATFTRSFKEAQTYLSFLPMVIGLPSVFLSFTPVKSKLIYMLVPTYGQSLLFNQILRGETLLTQHWLVASGVTLALAIVLVGVAVRLYQGEQVLFRQELNHHLSLLQDARPEGGVFHFKDYIIAAWITPWQWSISRR